ncbi:TetR/AcrR family transcriptional regulator [Paenibacillus hamazuiensis]|uniref:TetR/AcrR family transcriptional regulator n=1 Tax=Paenibacillus hamazuiensis TaxID=2936508 RepID=UPI00200BD373|nr:TetR/AcrR family transcriptional regulator [Paenibacillus hamazuiensis]
MKGKSTREHIVESADRLFYQRGYEHTSIADIADSVQISKGNFTYHFKSKDEILSAVIQLRLENTRNMLVQWEDEGERPEERIKSFINILIANQTDIKMYGCPVGTLCTELAKLNHASKAEANELFSLFRAWLSRQFAFLGLEANADELAMHLLARSQGVATLAQAFQDESFIKHEVELMCDWLSRMASAAQLTNESGGTNERDDCWT